MRTIPLILLALGLTLLVGCGEEHKTKVERRAPPPSETGAPKVYRARERPQLKKEDFPAYLQALIFDQKDSWTDLLAGPIKPQWGKIDAVNSIAWGRWTVSFGEKSPVVEWTDELWPAGNVFFYNLACKHPVLGEKTCMIRLVTNAENGQWLRCTLEIPLEDEKNQRVLKKKEKAFNINCPTEFHLK